jgi:hypothetical protein
MQSPSSKANIHVADQQILFFMCNLMVNYLINKYTKLELYSESDESSP